MSIIAGNEGTTGPVIMCAMFTVILCAGSAHCIIFLKKVSIYTFKSYNRDKLYNHFNIYVIRKECTLTFIQDISFSYENFKKVCKDSVIMCAEHFWLLKSCVPAPEIMCAAQ